MTKKSGRPDMGYSVGLKVLITPEMDRAIDLVVNGTGLSKASVVRTALGSWLEFVGLAAPGIVAALRPTKTTLDIGKDKNLGHA